MGTFWLVALSASLASAMTYIFKRVTDRVVDRGKLKADEATKIREEIRGDLAEKKKEIAELEARKDKQIAALEQRVATLEEELEKTERERNALDVGLAKYRLDVYRTLIDSGANKDLINAVLAIQER